MKKTKQTNSTKSITYHAKSGSRLNDKDAQVIGKELTRLGIGRGLTAAQVVEAAENPKSRIHSFFKWDDAVEARLWREHYARHLMNSIVIVYGEEEVKERAFVPIRIHSGVEAVEYKEEQEKQKRYFAVESIRTDEELQQQVTEDFITNLVSLAKRFEKYRSIEQFELRFRRVFGAIQSAAIVKKPVEKADEREANIPATRPVNNGSGGATSARI